MNHKEPETVILGRPRGGGWGLVNRVRGINHAKDAERLLTRWSGAGMDRLGHFAGWDFKIERAHV